MTTIHDPNSQSNVLDVVTKHISLNLKVDFVRKVFAGYVELQVEALKEAKELVVDTNHLNVLKSYVDGTESPFSKGNVHEVFGTAIHVPFPKALTQGGKTIVRIDYETTPESSAIQWLDPSQTAGKKHPYLFTQCQAIHARSMLPCQDSPQIKATYDASITVPQELTAVMSAVPADTETANGIKTCKFKQGVPMSSYLIAIAVGELESRDIGPRSRVWSEKSMVDAGAYEFAETETFLKIAEDLVGPYVWGRYDVLLLPPSFPYGGMENPCLTFVTPTLLAGDRSNADVVAHEISHSWTGNLVTNKTWEHFWLNEGFTVFMERKIYGRLYDEKMRHFKSIIGWKHLQDDVNIYGSNSPLTALVPDLKGIDPDDAFSSVPYEKGFSLLFYLEQIVGIDNFEKFLRAYIDNFKFSSLVTEDFKTFFLKFFDDKVDKSKLDQINWDEWWNKPGMPPVNLQFDQTLSNISKNLSQKWIQGGIGAHSDDIKDWSAGQIVVFLDELVQSPQALSIETLSKMDHLYSFSSTKNSEIRFRWYQVCIRSEYDSVFEGVASFLKEQGRMKFVRPLYRALYKSTKGKDLALKTFASNKQSYHSIAAKMIAKDLSS